LLTNRPRNARAMYDFRTLTIVSPPNDWPGLVHEMVHHLQFMAARNFDEKQAEAVEARAGSAQGVSARPEDRNPPHPPPHAQRMSPLLAACAKPKRLRFGEGRRREPALT
jgi:hypothetical protein